jgi:RNA polymerase-interacting CarD/CdnL/TRCF family regulator
MVIAKIGTRRELTPKDMDSVDVSVGDALDGRSVLKTRPLDDVRAYGLSFLHEKEVSILLDVDQAEANHLRRVASPTQIDEFLSVMHQSAVAKASTATPPEALLRVIFAANNDLKALARVYPYVHGSTDAMLSSTDTTLDTFFVQEIAVAKSLPESEAQAMLDRALRP